MDSLYPKFKDLDAFSKCKFVSFRHSGGSNGGFYDYTAKYGAMRDGDGKTLRESFDEVEAGKEKDALLEQLGLKELLDVPVIALSNGQTRRARIAKAILHRPEVLLLDEPLSEFLSTNLDRELTLISWSGHRIPEASRSATRVLPNFDELLAECPQQLSSAGSRRPFASLLEGHCTFLHLAYRVFGRRYVLGRTPR